MADLCSGPRIERGEWPHLPDNEARCSGFGLFGQYDSCRDSNKICIQKPGNTKPTTPNVTSCSCPKRGHVWWQSAVAFASILKAFKSLFISMHGTTSPGASLYAGRVTLRGPPGQMGGSISGLRASYGHVQRLAIRTTPFL